MADSINWHTMLYAAIGGVLPAIIWLIFWMLEDRKNPEPKRLVAKTFIYGMMAVVIVIPFQKLVDTNFPGLPLIAFLLWAVLEESFKFIAAYFGGIHSLEDNEPIDPIIYMITAALGFVALENTLFIATSLLQDGTVMGVITGNMRFIGASLLHTFTSGIIGVALGLSFYKSRSTRRIYTLIALILAIAFHTVFNTSIANNPAGTFAAFGAVWVGVAIIILSFERIKRIAPSM